jgi:hypothetical protein
MVSASAKNFFLPDFRSLASPPAALPIPSRMDEF